MDFDLQLSFVFWPVLVYIIYSEQSEKCYFFNLEINIYFCLFFYITWETLQTQTFVKMIWKVGKIQVLEAKG